MKNQKGLEKIYTSVSEAQKYLKSFFKKNSLKSILGQIEKIKRLKILIIGEAIIDEYNFGQAIGKSAKEPIIATKHLYTERYYGGVLSMANHLASYCDSIDVLTMLGDRDSCEEEIRQNLEKRIQPHFFYKKNSPTIVKRRFLENQPLVKLLEQYVINDEHLDEEQNIAFGTILHSMLPKYDLVIVTDFGHGMIDKRAVDILIKESKFLAVDVQANAGNMGYNTVSKYPSAHYYCIDEPEIRLEMRDRYGDLKSIVHSTMTRLSSKRLCVTRGRNGCFVYTDGQIISIPSFADKALDRMGAGDAFFTLTAPLVYLGSPPAIIGVVGNAIGAIAINILGNKKSITKPILYKYLKELQS